MVLIENRRVFRKTQDRVGMVKQAWERGWGTDLRCILEIKWEGLADRLNVGEWER